MEKSINTLEQLNEAFNQLDLSAISGVVHQSAVEGIVIFKSKRTGRLFFLDHKKTLTSFKELKLCI